MSKKKSEPVYQLPPEKKLTSLLALGRRTYKQVQSLSGEFGQAVANAAEHHHVHRKAFAVIRQLDRMENEKLAEFKAHFDDYYVKAGLQEREDSVELLPMEDDDKVVPIREAAE